MPYAGFVLGLFNRKLSPKQNQSLGWNIFREPFSQAGVTYSVITLNYDLVLENTANFIRQYTSSTEPFNFARPPITPTNDLPVIVKLHGSVDDGKIIPPTWNKTIAADERIKEEWKVAFKLLAEANCIRFIGYSLPKTDAYIRYLLKASVLANLHLKEITVICKDEGNFVKGVYDSFIKLPSTKYRFINADTISYLNTIAEFILKNNTLESGHQNFMVQPH